MSSANAGRPCTVCAHPRVAVVNDLLVEGMTNAEVSRRFEISQDAVRRHRIAHVVGQAEVATTPGAVAIATRLREVADAARDVRIQAAAAGNGALALRGGDAEARALTSLALHLGIAHEDVAAQLADGDTLAQVMFRLIARHPDAGAALLGEFRAVGQHDLADDLQDLVERHQSTQMREIA